jgi:hypothetical protein
MDESGPDLTVTPDLLPTSEAAALLGVSERHFRRRYAHRLQAVQGARGRLFYRRPDLDHVRDRQDRTEDQKVMAPDHDALTRPDHDQVRAVITMLQESHSRDLAARELAAAEVERAHQRELARTAELIDELRRRAEAAEVALASIRAQAGPGAQEPAPAASVPQASPPRPWWRFW